MKTITVFGGSWYSAGSPTYDMAYRLGKALAEENFALCNGGYGGTMAAAAKGASECGGRTVGITLSDKPNPWIQTNEPQPDHWHRMQTLLERGNGYVILPGGTGTLAEIGALLESVNKGFIPRSPVVFLTRHWEPLLDIVGDQTILREETGFSPTEGVEMRGIVAVTESARPAVDFLSVNLNSAVG